MSQQQMSIATTKYNLLLYYSSFVAARLTHLAKVYWSLWASSSS